PFPYSPSAIAMNQRILVPEIRAWIAGRTPFIVWTYLPTPLVQSLVARLAPSVLVYYCVDDLPASSDLARHVAPTEADFFRGADLVFVTTERLRQKALTHRTTVYSFPP